MVRKLALQGNFEFAEPEVIFKYLFGDDKFMKIYHKKVNYDPYAEVSSWNDNCQREVKYTASVQAPKMISTLLSDNFTVKEVQKYTKRGDDIVISSDPLMNPPGVDFFTHIETVLSPDKKGGCIVMVNVTLGIKGRLWGLEGAVENFMESKTRSTFDQWMILAKLFCQEEMALDKTFIEGGDQECFFDADGEPEAVESAHVLEPLSTPVNSILSRLMAAFSGTDVAVPSEVNTFLTQVVLRDVNNINISCEAIKGHVEKLNAKMLMMEHDMACMRSLLDRQPVPAKSSWRFFGLGLATGLCFGLTCMYIKRRQT